MTLLVLELRPPELDTTNLTEGLLAMLPRLYIYLIAFYSIANHWVVHQRMFRHITDMDTTMLWLTILSLLFITLIPAATAHCWTLPWRRAGRGLFLRQQLSPGDDCLALLGLCCQKPKTICQSFRSALTGDHIPGLVGYRHRLAGFHPSRFYKCLSCLCILDHPPKSGGSLGKSQAASATERKTCKVTGT